MKRITGAGRGAKQLPTGDVAATYNEFKEFEGRRYTGNARWPQP